MTSLSTNTKHKTPILLLKTKSTPHDGYHEFFSASSNEREYDPTFIPVLEHQFHKENLQYIKSLFEGGALSPGPRRKYGGLIFTSQRAVEAFAELAGEIDEQIRKSLAPSLILYTVGPATARSLATLRDAYLPGANIFGADSGTGENLAAVMLRHYNSVYGGMGVSSEHHAEERGKQGNEAGMRKPALLFLVGEQRRDIIPKTLMGAVPERDRIRVDEVVVYQTGVVAGFEGDFEGVVRRELACCFSRSQCSSAGSHPRKTIWVVVFSPTGCDAMLKVLSREDGLVFGREPNREASERRVFVATIGPTTRDHLINEYRFAPEVCAKKPSPEGVGSGIEEFMKAWEGK